MFKNTPTKKHKEFGSVYKACGGENVINIGMKSVKCITKEGDIRTLSFQVGDLVTRGLLAVSQLASLGAGIWFGPGPQFESYIVWDKSAFIAAQGPRIPITLNNGTYQIGVREVFEEGGLNAVGEGGEETPRPEGEDPQSPDPRETSSSTVRLPQSAEALGDRKLQDDRGFIGFDDNENLEINLENPP